MLEEQSPDVCAEPEKGRLLSDLRVNELKAELEKRGLESQGVKVVLSIRLNKALQHEGHDPATYRFTDFVATPATPKKMPIPKKAVVGKKIEALKNIEKAGSVTVPAVEETTTEPTTNTTAEIVGPSAEEGSEENDEDKNKNEKQSDEQLAEQLDYQTNVKLDHNADITDDTIELKIDEGDDNEQQKKSENVREKGEEVDKEKGKSDDQDAQEILELPAEKAVDNVDQAQEIKDIEEEKAENGPVEQAEKDQESVETVDEAESIDEDEQENEQNENSDLNGSSETVNQEELEEHNDDYAENHKEAEKERTKTPEEELLEDPLDEPNVEENNEEPTAAGVPVTEASKKREPITAPTTSNAATTKPKTSITTVGIMAAETEESKARSLWIRGLTTETSAASLKQICSKHGKVVKAKIFNSKAKKCGEATSCFGYITFSDPEMAILCVREMNGMQLNNKKLSVERACETGLLKKQDTSRPTSSLQKSEEVKQASSKRERIQPPKGTEKQGRERIIITVANDYVPNKEKARKERKPIVYQSSPSKSRHIHVDTRDNRVSQRVIKAPASMHGRLGRPPASSRTSGPMNESLIIRTRVDERGGPIHRSVERSIPNNISTSSLRRSAATMARTSRPGIPVLNRERERERERARDREREKELEMVELMRRRDEEHRRRENELQIERERDKLRFEKEKLERERLELEVQKQKLALERAAASVGSLGSRRPEPSRFAQFEHAEEPVRRRDDQDRSNRRDPGRHRNESATSSSSSSRRRPAGNHLMSPPRSKVHTEDRPKRRTETSGRHGTSSSSSQQNGNVYGIQSNSTRTANYQGSALSSKDYARSGGPTYPSTRNPVPDVYGQTTGSTLGFQNISSSRFNDNYDLSMGGTDLHSRWNGNSTYQQTNSLPTWGGLNSAGEVDLDNTNWPGQTHVSSSRNTNDWASYSGGSRAPRSYDYRGGPGY